MRRYIGIDIHATSATICVVSEKGEKVRQQVVETNGQAIVSSVRAIPGELHVAIEESEWSAWLHDGAVRRVRQPGDERQAELPGELSRALSFVSGAGPVPPGRPVRH